MKKHQLLLRVTDWRGNSALQGYEKWIRLAGFQWNFANSLGPSRRHSMQSSPREVSSVSITKAMDVTSPLFVQHCIAGTTFNEVLLVMVDVSMDAPAELWRIMLKQCFIETCTLGGMSSEAYPNTTGFFDTGEMITLGCSAFIMAVPSQANSLGEAVRPVRFGFDWQTCKPIE